MRSLARRFCAAVVLALTIPLIAAGPPNRLDTKRISVLMRDLDDDDFHVRKKADDELRAMGKAVLPLLEAERARSRSLEVRYRIDRIKVALTADDQISGWVRLLNHDDPQFREQASQALRYAGPPIVPLLKKEIGRASDSQCKARLEKVIEAISSASKPSQ